MSIIEVKNIAREFKTGDIIVHALRGVNLTVEKGEFVVILGASGSGKTTLLNQLGGIDKPTSGKVIIDGVDISAYNDRQMTTHRKGAIGWIFQFHNLIPSLTVTENVMLALEMMGEKKEQKARSIEAIKLVGLEEELDRFPSQISGGQQQRVAIARALVKRPAIIVGDEPTGNLDKQTGEMIVKLMHKICKDENITFITVTHDPSLSNVADRLLIMEDGLLREGEDEFKRFITGGK